MKKTLLTLFTVGLFNFANAQVSAYTFAQTSGSYTPITTGTSIATGTQDDSIITAKPIGFNFNYNGANYTTFGANINGWISLGSTAPSNSYNPISAGVTNNVISALGRDLKLGYSAAGSYTSGSPIVTMVTGGTTGFVVGDFFVTSTGFAAGTTVTAVSATTLTLSANATSTGTAGTYTVMGNIQFLTSGTAPNRTCTIQWTRARRYSFTASIYQNDFFNFQIKLTETSNTVAFVYGPFQTNSTSSKYEVGLRGSANTDFNNRKTTTNWAATTAGTLNTDTCSLTTTVKPAAGQTFTWSPPPVCSGPSITPTASAPTAVCSGERFDLVLTGYTPNVSGLTFQWQSSSAIGGPYTNLPIATTTTFDTTQTDTMYYKCLVSCSGGTAVASNIVTVTMSPLVNCNCTSSANFIADEEIFNVTVGTLNNTSSCTTTGGPGSVLKRYSNYTAVAAPTLSRTAANTFSVTIGTCGTSAYTSAFKIYIDFNKNGSFAEAGERVYTSDTATALTYTKSGSFTVPTSASGGNTLMRIVNTETDFANTIDSCGTYGYGETEDYFVNIPSLVGIEENEMLNTISVYPNPTTGLFNITTSNANFTQLTISVIDIQGKEVFNTSDKNYSANYNKQINLEGLAKGIYYIRLTTGTGVKTQKLIIQ